MSCRSLLPFLCCLICVGCAAKLSVVEPHSSRVRSSSQISENRKKWVVTIVNEAPGDVFCRRLAIRIVFDNPVNYLETGETVQLISDRYLRPKQIVQLTGNVPNNKSDRSTNQVRSVSVIDPDCTSATIYHFCSFAEKSEKERIDLARVGEVVGAETCTQIAEKFGRFEHRYLSQDDDPNSRPFSFILIRR